MSPVSASVDRRRVPAATVSLLHGGTYRVDSTHEALPPWFAPPPQGTGQGAIAYSVALPGLPTVEADVALSAPPTSHLGTALFVCGQNGSAPWLDPSGNPSMVSQLVSQGYLVVDLRWPSTGGWAASAPGLAEGISRVAARVAAMIEMVRATYAAGVPFILVGGSGASAAVTYALGWYGIKGIVDKLVVDSGPTNVRVTPFCESQPGFGAVTSLGIQQQSMFDSSFGYATGTGPCAKRLHMSGLYDSQGLDTAAPDLDWLPSFPIRVLWGGQDLTPWPHNAQDWLFFGRPRPPWFARPQTAPANSLGCVTVPSAGHDLVNYAAGASMVASAVVGRPTALQSASTDVQSSGTVTAAPVTMLYAHGGPVAVNGCSLLVGFVRAPAGIQGPPGWAQAGLVTLPGGASVLTLWYKVATGAEQAPDFTWGVQAGAHVTAVVVEYGFGLAEPVLDGAPVTAVSASATTSIASPPAPVTGNVGGRWELAVSAVATSASAGTWSSWGNGFTQVTSRPTLAVAYDPVPLAVPNPGSQVATSAHWSQPVQSAMITATFYGVGA